jgi:hypothetical protein
MNRLRKSLGLLWIAIGPVSIWYLVKTAAAEMAKKPILDTRIQWVCFIVIFLPIALGMTIFGFYALRGEYSEDSAGD